MSDNKPQHDPSMDDILASIRKIISDDEARAASSPDAEAAADALAPLPPLGPLLRRPTPDGSPTDTAPGAAAAAAPGATPADDDVLLLTELVDEPPGSVASKAVEPVSTLIEPRAAKLPADKKPVVQPTPSITPIPSPPKSGVMDIDEPQPSIGTAPLRSPAASSMAPVSPPIITNPQPSVSNMSASPPSSSKETAGKVSGAFERLNRAVVDAEPEASTPVETPLSSGGGGKSVEDLVREMLRPVLREWMDKNLPEMVEKQIEREITRLARR